MLTVSLFDYCVTFLHGFNCRKYATVLQFYIAFFVFFCSEIRQNLCINLQQESRAVARKPRDAAAVLFSLKFADDIHYKFKSSHASFEARLQRSRHTVTNRI